MKYMTHIKDIVKEEQHPQSNFGISQPSPNSETTSETTGSPSAAFTLPMQALFASGVICSSDKTVLTCFEPSIIDWQRLFASATNWASSGKGESPRISRLFTISLLAAMYGMLALTFSTGSLDSHLPSNGE